MQFERKRHRHECIHGRKGGASQHAERERFAFAIGDTDAVNGLVTATGSATPRAGNSAHHADVIDDLPVVIQVDGDEEPPIHVLAVSHGHLDASRTRAGRQRGLLEPIGSRERLDSASHRAENREADFARDGRGRIALTSHEHLPGIGLELARA